MNQERYEKIIENLNKFGRSYNLDYWNECGDDEGKIFDAQICTLDDYCEVAFDTLIFNKKGYNAFYNMVDKLCVENENFEAHLSHDVSGYNYWTLNMEESNYLFLTITFKKEPEESQNLDFELIMELIEDGILSPIKRYWDFLTSRKHYLRRTKC